jgi:hypothetical protein
MEIGGDREGIVGAAFAARSAPPGAMLSWWPFDGR